MAWYAHRIVWVSPAGRERGLRPGALIILDGKEDSLITIKDGKVVTLAGLEPLRRLSKKEKACVTAGGDICSCLEDDLKQEACGGG